LERPTVDIEDLVGDADPAGLEPELVAAEGWSMP
jgi:hypothetical protein